MSRYPFRLPDDKYVFRTLLGEDWVDKLQDPWAATQIAFLRQAKDKRGISVRPTAELCYKKVSPLRVQGIGKIRVFDLRMLVNPLNGQRVDVIQDSEDHVTIHNIPFHDDDPGSALDIASDIADLAMVLPVSEWREVVENARIIKPGVKAKIIAMLRSSR
jgi:hypothetical protein